MAIPRARARASRVSHHRLSGRLSPVARRIRARPPQTASTPEEEAESLAESRRRRSWICTGLRCQCGRCITRPVRQSIKSQQRIARHHIRRRWRIHIIELRCRRLVKRQGRRPEDTRQAVRTTRPRKILPVGDHHFAFTNFVALLGVVDLIPLSIRHIDVHVFLKGRDPRIFAEISKMRRHDRICPPCLLEFFRAGHATGNHRVLIDLPRYAGREVLSCTTGIWLRRSCNVVTRTDQQVGENEPASKKSFRSRHRIRYS